jgi:hypothetical protein
MPNLQHNLDTLESLLASDYEEARKHGKAVYETSFEYFISLVKEGANQKLTIFPRTEISKNILKLRAAITDANTYLQTQNQAPFSTLNNQELGELVHQIVMQTYKKILK